MDSSIVIRPAAECDAPAISDFMQCMSLETEGVSLSPETVLKGVNAVLDRSEYGFYIVAQARDAVVGCLMVTAEWSDWRNGLQWWIQSVYVNPAHRGQGIYRAMHQFVKNLALQDGKVVGLRLYVERNNDRAKAVYRNLGMEQTNYLVFEDPLAESAVNC